MLSKEATAEVPKLNLPAELLAEVSRRGNTRQTDFRVDAWKPSLLERLARMLGLG
jgi:hypothetical protein